MACLHVTIDLSILGSLSTPLDFNAQTVLTITGGTPTTVSGYYTVNNGNTQYSIFSGETIYSHSNEGNVFNYTVLVDDCVYTCTIQPQLIYDVDNVLQPYSYEDGQCEPMGVEIIYGCTNVESPNYDPTANVDDGSCEPPILGCMDPTADNYDPTATVDDGSCIYTISGCTDSRYEEYNENANVDDGSCTTLRVVAGCTNPLASNYNPTATSNDGSCIFVTGCTNPYADNYDENAVVDDGSCRCTEFNILLNFSGTTGTTLTTLSGQTCDYYLDLDLMLEAECGSILQYFQDNPNTTILGILNQMMVDFNVHLITNSGATLSQVNDIWNFDIEENPTGLYLYGTSGDCETLYQLLSIELGYDCSKLASDLFKREWVTYRFKISSTLNNELVQFSLNYKGFGVNSCSKIDNVRLFRTCEKNEDKCVLIPKTFGFNLEKAVDNKKSWVESTEKVRREYINTEYIEYDPKLVWNTKELTLRLNVIKYIDNDIIAYYNTFENFLDSEILKGLTNEKAKKELIDVRNRLTSRKYHFLEYTFDLYQDGLNDCALKSKQLHYDYIKKVLDKTETFWFEIIQQLVPATTIWRGSSHYYANSIFHQSKHKYKTYTIEKGDLTVATLVCNFVTNDDCDRELPYRSRFEKILQENDVCVTGNSITHGYINDAGYGTAKLVQYYTTGQTNNIIEIIDMPSGITYGSCSGETECLATVTITDVTTTDVEEIYTTTVTFTTTDVTDVNQLSAIVNSINYPITSFDIPTQTGTIEFEPLECENAVSIFLDADPCGIDSDSVMFGHCPIKNVEFTIPVSNPFNPSTAFSNLSFDVCCLLNSDILNITVTVVGISNSSSYNAREYTDCTATVPIILYSGLNTITITAQTTSCGEVTKIVEITV